ncbi:MAG: hypothetical protein HC904_17420 [Blastochloris sp.]|nr:hypothetical protein [Blastochloris sp.]
MLLFGGCSDPTPFSVAPVSAEDTFTTLITTPVPEGVKNLHGGSVNWQGYRAYLVFSIDASFLEFIQDRNLVELSGDSAELEAKEEFQPDEDVFREIPILKKIWIPEQVEAPLIYRTQGGRLSLKNDWTHSGEEMFLIDRKNMTVYYKSNGA